MLLFFHQIYVFNLERQFFLMQLCIGMPKGKRALLGSNPPATSIPLTLESARGGSGTGVASLFQESLMARKTHAIRPASEFTGKHSVYSLGAALFTSKI